MSPDRKCIFAALLCIWTLVASMWVVASSTNRRFVTHDDTAGADREILQHLLPLVRLNHQAPFCSNSSEAMGALRDLDSDFIDSLVEMKLPHGGFGIVSKPRKRCTALLTKAALTLPVGDVVETGTFIGTSAAIMMKILQEFDTCNRKLWVFDSFEGLPPPTKEDANQGATGNFKATEQMFLDNMRSLGQLRMNALVVSKGWFATTCPQSKVQKIALLRLDGDLYASTWDAIDALYDRVVPGGLIYIDDYGSFVGCRRAVDKFRTERGIFEPLHYVRENSADSRSIIFEAVWWMKRIR